MTWKSSHALTEGAFVIGPVIAWGCVTEHAVAAVGEIVDGAIHLKAAREVF